MQSTESTKSSLRSLLPFFIKGGIIFVLYLVFYEFGVADKLEVDRPLLLHLSEVTAGILDFLGYKTFLVDNRVGIDGSSGVLVGAPCDGISLFVLFAGFIIAFRGPVKHKLWYIPAGILAIHALNIIRVVSLALIVHYAPDSLDFHHSYTFTLLVYAFVFGGWMLWVKKFAVRSKD